MRLSVYLLLIIRWVPLCWAYGATYSLMPCSSTAGASLAATAADWWLPCLPKRESLPASACSSGALVAASKLSPLKGSREQDRLLHLNRIHFCSLLAPVVIWRQCPARHCMCEPLSRGLVHLSACRLRRCLLSRCSLLVRLPAPLQHAWPCCTLLDTAALLTLCSQRRVSLLPLQIAGTNAAGWSMLCLEVSLRHCRGRCTAS